MDNIIIINNLNTWKCIGIDMNELLKILPRYLRMVIGYLRMLIGSFFIYVSHNLPIPPISIGPNRVRKVSFSIEKTESVSVISYNIHSGRDILYRDSIDKMINIIETYRPQVLCLQEINSELFTHTKNSLGYRYGYHAHNKGILSDHELMDTHIHYFNHCGIYSDTSLLRASIKKGSDTLTVVNTQLSFDITLYKQCYELEELRNYISDKIMDKNKLVVVGDFNIANININTYYRYTITEMISMLEELELDHTYPSCCPVLPLDKCFFRNIEIRNKKTIDTKNSWHRPISIELV